MKRPLLVALLLITLMPCMNAQKKEMDQARTFIKSGKNLEKAENMMNQLLKDSANRKNEKIYLVLFDAIRAQYEQGNEKLYLHQKYDTLNLFKAVRRMFRTLETLDTLDASPDKKGRVRLKYRKKHAELLMAHRNNLYNGGVFQMFKREYADAYDYFDAYIDCARQPLFAEMKIDSTDHRLPLAAYRALFCGFQLQDTAMTLKHSQLALRDTANQSYVLQYLAETYRHMGNRKQYLHTLRKGFDHDPEFPYFYPRLLELYSEEHQGDSALAVVNRLLEKNDSSEIYLFAKSSVLLNNGSYAECITICDTLIARNDSLADAYLNAGLAYTNLAVEMDKVSKSRTKRSQIKDYYRKAKPYLERGRVLAPDQKDKWARALYDVYLNLNMGKQFDEMDRILKKG